ncbi:hypothetical protein WAF17_06135 [Bernardetia sp. ABR2-2B]|uniref:hypothetical protein n=1 Tax=Bernardetia sp. ABR2-2B TaxID=3127472 RepID=UPI0030CCAA4E
MKKYALTFLFFLFSFSAFAQNFDSSFVSSVGIPTTAKEQLLNQENEILMLLFDGIEITTKHQENEVKWKPNFYENKQPVTSDDDFAYTQLDSIFFYQEGNTKKAVIIFATYVYENNRVINFHFYGAYVSVATFEYDEKLKKWQTNNFDKFYGMHGVNGWLHPISLKQIGKEKFALFFYSGFTHMGEDHSWTTIYDLSKCEKLKTIYTFYDYLYFSEEDKDKKIDKDIEFDATQINNYKYYDLIITTKKKNSTKVEVFEYQNLEGYVLKE